MATLKIGIALTVRDDDDPADVMEDVRTAVSLFEVNYPEWQPVTVLELDRHDCNEDQGGCASSSRGQRVRRMPEHTPGPWKIEADLDKSILITAPDPDPSNYGMGRLDVEVGTDDRNLEVATANAQLICVAPTMEADIGRTIAYYRLILPYLREIAEDTPRFSHLVTNTELEMTLLEATLARANGEQP